MKKVCLIIFLLSCGLLQAQEEETLLGSGKIHHGGFGGPVVKFARVKNEFGVLVGGYGGWLINHTFMIGGGGYGLSNRIKADKQIQSLSPGKTQYIQFGYGGLMLEYISNGNKLFHPMFQLLIGGGNVNYVLYDQFDEDTPGGDNCFTLEGGASMEMNIVKYMRICLGASYLLVNGIDVQGLDDSDFGGLNLGLTLKFGSF
ncbi:MAG: hypothetical protein ACM3SM_00565 [Bacteroidota bacterium]